MLHGKNPEAVQKKIKLFMYGSAKVGKTTAAIQFPKPYLIDTEKGAENKRYTDLLSQNGGAIFQSSNYDEILAEIRALLTEQHDFKTLIIDPLTTIYSALIDLEMQKAEKSKNSSALAYGRPYIEVNKKIKRLANLLLQLDMNVVITSHSKIEYDENMVKIGETFDCYKKMDYLFDLIIHIAKDAKSKARIATVKGSRLEGFSEDENFEFSYNEIKKRYNSEFIEQKAIPKTLISDEQLRLLSDLIATLKIDQITQQKWLDKAGITDFEDLDSEIADKIINNLNERAKYIAKSKM